MSDSAFKLAVGMTLIIPIISGLIEGPLWGLGAFGVFYAFFAIREVMSFTSYTRELDAHARVLEAVSRLRATDDPQLIGLRIDNRKLAAPRITHRVRHYTDNPADQHIRHRYPMINHITIRNTLLGTIYFI